MPVCTRQLYSNRIIIPDLGAKRFKEHHQQRDHSTQYMQHMQSEYYIKKLTCSRTFKINSRSPQLVKSGKLKDNEQRPQYCSYSDEPAVLHHAPFFKCLQRHLDSNTARYNRHC